MTYTVAALYHFFDFPHFADMRQEIIAELSSLSVKGSLLLAAEGINGTLAGSRESIDSMLAYLQRSVTKEPFEHKESLSEEQPFNRLRVRLKKETISMGEPIPMQKRGIYVEPKDWNALIDDPEMVIIDARNDYEFHMGAFEGARNPDTKNFRQLPTYVRSELSPDKNKKIATYCTGGIRCEKFTAWLVDQGYEEVYHLKGGILKYLEEIPQSESKWQGECYVFDNRVAVGHALVPSATATMCRCGHPLTPEDRAHPAYVEKKSCAYCATPRS